jgi:malate dehydrogenase (oxaloacetate-decarboxylating)
MLRLERRHKIIKASRRLLMASFSYMFRFNIRFRRFLFIHTVSIRLSLFPIGILYIVLDACYTGEMDTNELALQLHKEHKGKITIALRDTAELTREKLSAYYSPGVGAVSSAIAADPSKLPEYTWTNNLVAVISDGSAVLGLGNIGPEGAMPVMEGKALLFKHFANIDSVPIVMNVHTADEIVATVKAIAPSFGAINLEDIAAPICFEVEERLKAELSIPIMHDDQHGTATVTLAGLINAMKVTNRELKDCKIVVVGAGAAGVAIAKLLQKYANPNIIAVDSKGIISKSRTDLNESKQLLLQFTNSEDVSGSLEDAIKDADIFIGVSQPGLLTAAMIKSMKKDPIIFALANPVPEIMPDEAKAAGAAIVATGRSDFPNQVNNAIAFPGIFRGALDNHVSQITDEHKIAAAEVIASLVENPLADEIIPSVFNDKLVPAIANVIR